MSLNVERGKRDGGGHYQASSGKIEFRAIDTTVSGLKPAFRDSPVAETTILNEAKSCRR